MKKIYLLISIALLMFGCSPEEESVVVETPEEKTEEMERVSSEKRFADVEITYLEGWVTLIQQGEERDGQIGDLLQQGDQILVDSGSTCEIQLGDLSLIRVEENTRITLTSSLQTENGTRGEILLSEGSIFSKVKKIVDEDSFQVRTDSAVCGVRGTEFLVRKDKDQEDVQVAVLEGAVAMTPPDIDWEDIRQKAGEGDDAFKEEMKRIEESFPVVMPGEEMQIGKEDLETLNQELQKVKQIVEATPSDAEENQREDVSAALEQIREVRQRVSAVPQAAVSRPIERETRVQAEKIQASFTRTLPEREVENTSEPEKETEEESAEKAEEAVSTVESAEEPAVIRPESRRIDLKGAELIGEPVLSGRNILVTDKNGVLSSVAGGSVNWQVQTGNSGLELSRPVAGGSTVLLAGKQRASLYNILSGSETAELDSSLFTPLIFGQVPLIQGQTLYYPVLDGLLVYEIVQQKMKGKIEIASAANMTPALYRGQILMADISGTVHFINGSTLESVAQVPSSAVQPVAASISVYQNRGVLSGRKGNAVAMDLQNRSLLWEISLPSSPVYSTAETGAEGSYFFSQNSILAYNWAGEPLFVLDGASAPPLYTETGLIWGDHRGNLIVSDPATGREIDRYPLGTVITGKPGKNSEGEWVLLAGSGVIFLKNFPE